MFAQGKTVRDSIRCGTNSKTLPDLAWKAEATISQIPILSVSREFSCWTEVQATKHDLEAHQPHGRS
jgi:hypothetical protein